MLLLQRLFLIICFFSVVTSVDAAYEGQARRQMIDHGKAALLSKDFLGAIDDFSRALLLEPDDQELQRLLLGLSSQKSLPAEISLQLHLTENLLQHNQNLKQKIYFYKQQESLLKSKTGPLGQSLKSVDVADKDLAFMIERRAMDDMHPLLIFNTLLEHKNDALEQDIFALNRNISRLNQLNRINDLGSSSDNDNVYVAQNPMFRFYDQWGNRIDGSNNPQHMYAKTEVPSDQIDQMQKVLEKLLEQDESQEGQMRKFKEEVVHLTLLVNEKNTQLEMAAEGMKALSEQLADVQSRFDLSQRLLNQKDLDAPNVQGGFKDIDSLVEGLKEKDKALMNSGKVIKQQSERIQELSVEVFMLNVKLDKSKQAPSTIKERDLEDGASLNLKQLHETLSNKNNLLSTMQDNLLILNNQMTNLEEKLGNLNVSPTVSNGQQLNLANSLNNVKNYVEDMNKFLDHEIKNLESYNVSKEQYPAQTVLP